MNADLRVNGEPVSYIKIYSKNTVQPYKIVDRKYAGRMVVGIYEPIPILGTSNFVSEYNFFGDIKSSLLRPEVRKTTVGTAKEFVQGEEDSMDAIINAIKAEDLETTEDPNKQVQEETTPKTTQPQVTEKKKKGFWAGKIDEEATTRMEVGKNYDSYKKAINDRMTELGGKEAIEELKRRGELLTEEDWLTLSEEDKESALYQIRNCKK